MSADRESLLVTTIPLRSLRCRACSYRLLRVLRRIDGVIDARIEALPSAAIVTHERSVPPWRLTESLRAAGADPAAAELALPVATPAGAEEAARRIEIELTALDGVDGAAVDLARHEVRAIYRPGTVGADAIRDRIAAFGWGPAHPAPAAGSADPAQKAAARIAIRRALAATLAASVVTVLGALTGPGALAPFLQLIPDAAAALRRSIPIAPAPPSGSSSQSLSPRSPGAAGTSSEKPPATSQRGSRRGGLSARWRSRSSRSRPHGAPR